MSRDILVRQGWKNVDGDFWTPPTSGAWIKFDKAIEVATSPEFANIRRILGMRDVFPRMDGDAINVTMQEFCRVKDEMEGGDSHKMSFAEGSIRCQKVCEMLGVEMEKMVNRQWRVVVVDGEIVRGTLYYPAPRK